MQQGPLSAEELEWLENILIKYASESSMLDVAELDGFLTAILSGPNPLAAEQWLSAIWGGEAPGWASESEQQRFTELTLQHMHDIAERLNDYPEQFEPLFGTRNIDDRELTIVEEWCFGYMKGVAVAEWPPLPESVKPELEVIALHGAEENFARLDTMSAEAFEQSLDNIHPAALSLHRWWKSQPSTLH